MTTAATLGMRGALEALNAGSGAMSLQHWMTLNRDALLKEWGPRRLDWKALCQWFRDAGLTNRDGNVVSIPCAQVMWSRVGKSLAARKARLEAENAEAEARDREKQVADQLALEEERDRRERAREQARLRKEKIAEAQEGVAARELEAARARSRSVLWPDSDITPTPAPEPVTLQPQAQEPASTGTARVKIGEVAKVVIMRKQAPRYGDSKLIPLPEPYVGPRPHGMPEDLPLEALMPLTASGMTADGKFDFEQMPGLPRMSFFATETEWALCCYPMIKAVPPLERSGALKAMFEIISMKLRR